MITTNGTSIDHPVVIKLEPALTSIDGETVKSDQKRKTGENKVQPTKKSTERELIHTDLIDLNDVQATYIQMKSNVKALIEPIEVLHSLLMSHTALKLKALCKTFNDSKTPPLVKYDLAVQLTQMISKRQDILHQNRIHSSTVIETSASQSSVPQDKQLTMIKTP